MIWYCSFFIFSFYFDFVTCSVCDQPSAKRVKYENDHRGLSRSHYSDSNLSSSSVEAGSTVTSSVSSSTSQVWTPVNNTFDLFFRVLKESGDEHIISILSSNREKYQNLFLEAIDFATDKNYSDSNFTFLSFESNEDFVMKCVIVSFFVEAYLKRVQIRNTITSSVLYDLVKTISVVPTTLVAIKYVEGLLIKLALTGDLWIYNDLLVKYRIALNEESGQKLIYAHCLQYFASCNPYNKEEGVLFRINLQYLLDLFPRLNVSKIFEPSVEFASLVPESYFFVTSHSIATIQSIQDLLNSDKSTSNP